MSPYPTSKETKAPRPVATQLVTVLLTASFLVGCATSTRTDSIDGVTANAEITAAAAADSIKASALTSDGLKMVRSTPRSMLWVRPDHYIGRYDDIMVSEIAFAYGQGQTELDEGQEDQVGEMLVEAIGGITQDGPVGEASDPGPCVVALQLGLKDIHLHLGEASQGSSTSFVSSFGSATMIVEFRDSMTDTTLLRYAANRGLGSGTGTGRVGANMGRLGRALGEMVTDMTTELQTIVPDTTARPATECNDGIYKLTGRG